MDQWVEKWEMFLFEVETYIWLTILENFFYSYSKNSVSVWQQLNRLILLTSSCTTIICFYTYHVFKPLNWAFTLSAGYMPILILAYNTIFGYKKKI